MVNSQLGLFKKATEEKERIKAKQSAEKIWKLQGWELNPKSTKIAGGMREQGTGGHLLGHVNI